MVSSTDFVRASERATAIATLNRQRHLTPSWRVHPYRGENSGPGKAMFVGDGHPDPELENNICLVSAPSP